MPHRRRSIILLLLSLCVPSSAFVSFSAKNSLLTDGSSCFIFIRQPLTSVFGGWQDDVDDYDNDDDDAELQWNQFKAYHAKGSWKGIWTTYDYIGDVMDETVAAVVLDLVNEGSEEEEIRQTHQIVVGATKSDCATCFDQMEIKTIPVATYTKHNLKRTRLAACAMINGPTVLKSGVLATELILSHGDGRVRVIFQHAPVWARDVAPASCPPQGLKLFRVMVSREALRDTAPTPENVQSHDNPLFFRPVPPFDWHKDWTGTSWTWGPSNGNRGWMIEQLQDDDAWHGVAPVDRWNLKLFDGIFVQTPRVITDAETSLYRIAWLPNSETMLRTECGVLALQPMYLDDQTLTALQPPSLVSLRCDILKSKTDNNDKSLFSENDSLPHEPS